MSYLLPLILGASDGVGKVAGTLEVPDPEIDETKEAACLSKTFAPARVTQNTANPKENFMIIGSKAKRLSLKNF